MQFHVLGPVGAREGGQSLDLGGPQQKLVLAVLLANGNSVVSIDRLIDALWGDTPPATAKKTIQGYVSSLRHALGSAAELLETRPPGYRMRIAIDELDALSFAAALQRAGVATDPGAAAAMYGEALAKWRGSPYEDVADSDALRPEIVNLQQMRLAAQEGRLEALVMAGEHERALPGLEALSAEHPFREQLRALHMLALYRSGRQSDALAVYGDTRRTLAEELGLEPSQSLQRVETRILNQDPILDTLAALGGEEAPKIVDREVRNPYKGLRPFTEADSEDFFGRSDLVRQLVERLERRDVSGRFVALVGASGSGKSSVVAAGLIPRLRAGAVPGSDRWRIATMYPGADPFGNLAAAIAVLGQPAADDRLGGDGPASVHALAAEETLLVIDQFEELFTQGATAGEVDQFLDQLVDAARTAGTRLRVIVMIRADYLDLPLDHPSFAELLGPSMILVPALSGHEVRDAVMGPASRVGVSVEPELVATLVADVGSRPAALPLLQFALTDAFDRRSDELLTAAAYQSIGGLLGALTQRADGMYVQFDDREKEVCRQVMLRLVTAVSGGGVVRRRIPSSDVAAVAPEATSRVIDELVRNRLITFDRPRAGEATVEIAHEALIREWPRLQNWIDASRRDLVTQTRIAQASDEWIESGRDEAFLLSGTRLGAARAWLDDTDLEPGMSEAEFIAESEAQERRVAAARVRRRRATVAVLAIAAVVSAVFGVIAIAQRNNAQRQARVAVARELAASALTSIDDDPQLSILLALEAAATTRQDDLVLREAVEALHQAMLASRIEWVANLGTGGKSIGARFSPDGRRIAAGSADGSVRLFVASTGELLATLRGLVGDVGDVRWTDAGTIVTVGASERSIGVWDGDSGELLQTLTIEDGPLLFDVSSDGSLVAASTTTGDVVVLESATGAERLVVPVGSPAGVAIDPVDGSRLAVANLQPEELGGGLLVLDSATGEELLRIPLVDGACDVAWTPDGSLIGVAADVAGHVLDAATGSRVATFDRHHSFICSIGFGPDGELAITGGDDGAARVWETRSAREVLSLGGHTERVGWVNFSPDGDRVLSTSPDGTLRVWDVRPEGRRESVAVYDPSVVFEAVYVPGTDLFLTGSFSGEAGLWGRGDGELRQGFRGHEHYIYGVAVSAPVDLVATGSRDGTVRLWTMSTGDELDRIETGLPVFALDMSSDGMLVGYGTPISAHLFDRSTEQEIPLAGSEGYGSFSVRVSPDATRFAAANGNLIGIWDTTTGAQVLTFDTGEPGAFDAIQKLAFNADGSLLVAATRGGQVMIFDAASGVLQRLFTGHSGLVWDADLSPDGRVLASASFDGTVRLWDAATGEETLRIEEEVAPTSVDFSEDGERLLVAGDFGAWIYEVDTENLLDLARSRLVRWWTPEECFQYLGTVECPQRSSG